MQSLIPQPGYVKICPNNGDTRFPSMLQGFNQRWFAGNCKAIYLCYTTIGTALALDDAIASFDKGVRIKSGGHCYEDFVFNDETGAVIDVTPMQGYGYDKQKGYFLEAGGTNWSAFQALFRDYGKVLPAGSCYSVGLGGHICGGGYGLLSRLNGLTVDWLTGVEVVVKKSADGNSYPLYVSIDSADSNELDLYWAHQGGGGGNFGVITKYYFKDLPKAPRLAFLTAIAFPWEKLTEAVLGNLLAWFARFSQQADNRQFALFALNHSASGEIHLTIQTVVFDEEDPDVIRDQYITPTLEDIARVTPFERMTKRGLAYLNYLFHTQDYTALYTFYEAVQMMNGPGANQRGKYKSAYMRKAFPEDQVSVIYKWLKSVPLGLTDKDMAQSLLQVDTYGGEINKVHPQATAIPQRSSIMKLQYQTYWSDKNKDQLHLDWIRGFYNKVYQKSGGTPNPEKDPSNNVDGCYYNYPDVDLNGAGDDKEIALKLYFGENLDRLKKIKKQWDPEGYFNSKQSL